MTILLGWGWKSKHPEGPGLVVFFFGGGEVILFDDGI